MSTKKYLETFCKNDFRLDTANVLNGGPLRRNPYYLLSSVIKIINEDTYANLEGRSDHRSFLCLRYVVEAAAVTVGDPGGVGRVPSALVPNTRAKSSISELFKTLSTKAYIEV